MDPTRRDALKAALMGALLAAAPPTLALAKKRGRPAREVKLRLKDGSSIVAGPKGVFHETSAGRTKVQQGRFVGADGSSLVVQGGRLSPTADGKWLMQVQPAPGDARSNDVFAKQGGPIWVQNQGSEKPGSRRAGPKAKEVLEADPRKNRR